VRRLKCQSFDRLYEKSVGARVAVSLRRLPEALRVSRKRATWSLSIERWCLCHNSGGNTSEISAIHAYTRHLEPKSPRCAHRETKCPYIRARVETIAHCQLYSDQFVPVKGENKSHSNRPKPHLRIEASVPELAHFVHTVAPTTR